MPDGIPPGDASGPHEDAGERAGAASEAVTPDGYPYTVVPDGGALGAAEAPSDRRGGPGGMNPLLLVGAALAPAIVVGVAVWFLASALRGGSDHRKNADVTSVLNILSGQRGVTSQRYEGALPPGFPGGVPAYPGAHLLSSVKQVRDQDASYLVVYDVTDGRPKAAKYFHDKFSAGDWQIDAGQDGPDYTLHQFSKTNDNNVTGLVLVADSKDGSVTTILLSLQVTSGAKAAKPAFSPGPNRPLPEGFPAEVPQYPGSTEIRSLYQKQPSGSTYAASFVTKDEASKALDYYRGKFKDNGWTVHDADASQSSLKDAEAISFADGRAPLTGSVAVGKLAEDESYTRIDVQVEVPRSRSGGGQ